MSADLDKTGGRVWTVITDPCGPQGDWEFFYGRTTDQWVWYADHLPSYLLAQPEDDE